MEARSRDDRRPVRSGRYLAAFVVILLPLAVFGWALSGHENGRLLPAIIGRNDLDNLSVERRSWLPNALASLELKLGANRLFNMTLDTVKFGAQGPAVDDERLRLICGLRNIEELTLSEARISDAALSQLAALPGLRSVDFTGTPITDAGLTHLGRVRSLKSVILTRTKATRAGIAKLQEALPECSIESLEERFHHKAITSQTSGS